MKKIHDKDNDFGDIMIMALRYALGRRTYVTVEVPAFIMQNKDEINKRICFVMLRDLESYVVDRLQGNIKDDDCDYKSWVKLIQWLFDVAKEKGYDVSNINVCSEEKCN